MKDNKGHGSNKKTGSSLPNPFSEVKSNKDGKASKPKSRDKALPNPFGGSRKQK